MQWNKHSVSCKLCTPKMYAGIWISTVYR